jgi:hypothetical protein
MVVNFGEKSHGARLTHPGAVQIPASDFHKDIFGTLNHLIGW